MMTTDEKYMLRCLQLAGYGAGNTAPNPMVGAVIVADGKIIGEGYHARYGEAHAEVNAIAAVADEGLLHRATLYVSLEPCSHYGKTPPCAELIIRKGIPRVVVGCRDPFEKVSGRGIALLREAGVDVTVGVLETECLQLIKRFVRLYVEHRPYITLKWAQSADGFLDRKRTGGSAARLSTDISMMAVHRQRTLNQAIMVGRRTAELDNPKLTVRDWSGRQPLRIVLDRNRSLPPTLHLFDGTCPTLVFTEADGPEVPNVEFCHLDFTGSVLEQLLDQLYQKQIQTLFVEGGTQLLQTFIDGGKWDEIFVEHSQLCLGDGIKAPILPDGIASEFTRRDGHTIEHLLAKIDTSPHLFFGYE